MLWATMSMATCIHCDAKTALSLECANNFHLLTKKQKRRLPQDFFLGKNRFFFKIGWGVSKLSEKKQLYILKIQMSFVCHD